jgi:hypothetical protein
LAAEIETGFDLESIGNLEALGSRAVPSPLFANPLNEPPLDAAHKRVPALMDLEVGELALRRARCLRGGNLGGVRLALENATTAMIARMISATARLSAGRRRGAKAGGLKLA